MKTLPRSFPVVFFSLFAATAAQAETIYDCTFKNTQSSGLMAPQVVFSVAPESGKVMVSDAYIQHFTKTTAIAGEVKSDNAKKLTIGWELAVKNNTNQNARLSYRISYLKQEKKAFMTVAAMGYTNNDRAEGSCKVKG